MSKLEEKIEDFQYYEKEFATWEAKEIIIDDKKAFWELRKPNSEYRKVCLFRDRQNMYVYGDYGSFTFNSITWLGTPKNLEYNNIRYQMEKLDGESEESLRIFDDFEWEKDIGIWIEEYLKNEGYDNYEELSNNIIVFVVNTGLYSEDDIFEYCKENNISELYSFIKFILECYENRDESDWTCFLSNSNLEDFDEPCESSLWNAGIKISQKYYINMYALKVLGGKLNE